MGFKNIYIMNPVDISFFKWVNQNPESFHALDIKRFYSFVDTLYFYKRENSKWFCKEYFLNKCKDYGFYNEKYIEHYYDLMMIVINYKNCHSNILMKTTRYIIDPLIKGTENYYQEYLINDKIERLKITKEEFNKRKIGKKEFQKRINKARFCDQ